MGKFLILTFFLLLNASSVFAQTSENENILDRFDPADPHAEQILQALDQKYQAETGLSPFLPGGLQDLLQKAGGCHHETCAVWAQIVKSRQRMYLYIDGELADEWKVSTGTDGHGTPNLDRHPNGRIYEAYSSKKFPGGDYYDLGNMPYAVFVSEGVAIHGTAASRRLGKRASHGCIRLDPNNARYFNRLVRDNGVQNVWVTIQD